MIPDRFEKEGFALIPAVLGEPDLQRLLEAVSRIDNTGAGTRSLLDHSWCAALARTLHRHAAIAQLVPAGAVAVQCTYFEKSREQNWLVPVHQDLSIPVREKILHDDLTGWSEKEGTVFVQLPVGILEKIIIVRLHLDDCREEDGPLRVVTGSHRGGRIGPQDASAIRDASGETICRVPAGGALMMKPLLLHASSKASGQGKRRVLHFVFGPQSLPYGLKWQYAVC
jgi:ectoine hydroxylase-related dioxygenase (phytanoyl-CoA dioxygenase family)